VYQSQQYLEIAGRYIASPYSEEDSLHGVCLYDILCHIHEAGTRSVSDIAIAVMKAIQHEIGLRDMAKVEDIFDTVMTKLEEMQLFT
jgi:hypothetical protein